MLFRSPAAATIVGATKITGRTRGGLSLGALSAVTQATDGRAFYTTAGGMKTFKAEPRAETRREGEHWRAEMRDPACEKQRRRRGGRIERVDAVQRARDEDVAPARAVRARPFEPLPRVAGRDTGDSGEPAIECAVEDGEELPAKPADVELLRDPGREADDALDPRLRRS